MADEAPPQAANGAASYQGISALVFPKVSPEERATTALSEVQRARKQRLNVEGGDIKLWSEVGGRGDTRHAVYHDLSLKLVGSDAAVALGPGDKGVVRQLNAIGGDVVWLPDGAPQLERLTEGLGEQYIVSGNSRLIYPEAPGFT